MQRAAQLNVLFATACAPAVLLALTLLRDRPVLGCLLASAALAYFAFRWTCYLIPLLAPRHQRAGLVGKDINKKGTDAGDVPVPESLGLAPGVVCLVCLALTHMLHTLQVWFKQCTAEECHGHCACQFDVLAVLQPVCALCCWMVFALSRLHCLLLHALVCTGTAHYAAQSASQSAPAPVPACRSYHACMPRWVKERTRPPASTAPMLTPGQMTSQPPWRP